MKKLSYLFLTALIALCSCDLEESPITETDKDAVFGSADGLKAYSLSLYDNLPTADGVQQSDVSLTDFFSRTSIDVFIMKGAYNESNATSWSWTALRNINYFIVNCENSSLDKSVIENYLGIGRFFRAYFYFDKVKTYGDVPWIDRPLQPEDEELYAPRDSRELVMENVWNDLKYAQEHISQAKENTCTYVTKWAAYALASRIALFEGTYRKYHNLNLATSAETWLQRAAESAKYLMDNGGYSLYTADGEKSYRNLFTSDAPKAAEIIMCVASSAALNMYHQANWQWNVASYGVCPNFVRTFVNTYLMKDGTPYTDKTGYENDDFYTEFQDRDARMSASMRYPGYVREGAVALPDFQSFARIGYHPMKLSVDSKAGDLTKLNTNSMPLFRYAEVLLNYAEAKAELGQLSDDDWNKTIGALRQRAGVVGSKPSKVDSYFQQNYFPSISDINILEVRRERGIELCFEGRRWDDIRRWKAGHLLLNRWTGMHITEINKALDVDRNGTPDVIYYTSNEGLEQAKAAIDWDKYKATCAAVPVTTDLTATGGVQLVPVGNGYDLAWDCSEDAKRVFADKQYLYPIPAMVITRNPNISQNPGWENGASN